VNVLITGGNGFLGQALQKMSLAGHKVFAPDRQELDLLRIDGVANYLVGNEIDYVIHAAAKVGGIKDNSQNNYEFFRINSQINNNLLHGVAVATALREISMVGISSTCTYPKCSPKYPMREDMAAGGEPELTNMGYALAKRHMEDQMMLMQAVSQMRTATVYLTNLYGPNDHFGEMKSHVIPDLIHKFHEAKVENKPSVELYGTGSPMRQFLYVEDAARAIWDILDCGLIGRWNVAPRKNHTIKDVVGIVEDTIQSGAALDWNGKLDGVYRKDVSSAKFLREFSEFEFTSFIDGIEKTYEWYKTHCDNVTV